MTEWSEYFCKALNKKLETFKTVCDECIQSEKKCHDNNKGKECEKCKEKCSKYKDFVNKWKDQYDLQAKAYEELYDKANKNTNIYVTNDDNFAVEFLKDVKSVCTKNDPSSAEKYLYKTSNCKQYKFKDESTHPIKIYSFKEYPEGYENHCTCEITQHPLDDCPDDTNKEVCSRFQVVKRCMKKDFNNDLDNWNSYGVEDFKGKNAGVLVPPRRRHLCLYNTIINLPSMVHKNDFKKVFLNAVYTEGKLLWDKYGENSNDVMEAMKYSFADYADIIKGTDMLDTTTSKKINKRLLELLNVSNNDRRHATSWWKNNRSHIWHAMLCGYKKANDKFVINSDTCKLPNEDEIPQFLRWLLEWAKQACKEKKIRKQALQTKCYCSNPNEISGSDIIKHYPCKSELTKYIQWNLMIKELLDQLNIKYQNIKASNNPKNPSEINAEEYIETELKEGECNLVDIERIYNKIKQEHNPLKEILMYLCPNLEFPDDTFEYIGKTETEDTTIEPETPTSDNPEDSIPSISPEDVHPTTGEDTNIFNSNILSSTIPFGIALALSSIAFLFLK
ncbi:hypothetical protein PFTANZ_01307, partial [Plasmodium falciparum Tanzania (2000708)]